MGGLEASLGERRIGTVTHYFDKIGVAAIDLTDRLRVGDRIHITGHTTDVTTAVDRMQVDNADVHEAGPGQDLTAHVGDKVRQHDAVLLIED